MKTNTKLSAAFVAAGLALTASTASAAVVVGNASPTDDGDYDILYAPSGTSFGESITTEDAGNRLKGVGNSFTSDAVDTTQLNSFSMFVQDRDGSHSALPASLQSFVVTVGEIGGSGFTSLQTETASATMFIGTGEWLTFTLDTPLVMNANTEYGFILNVEGPDTWSLKADSPSGFSGGARLANNWQYDSETANVGFDKNTGRDVQFHADISAVPEPSTTALLGLGGLALIFRRRK